MVLGYDPRDLEGLAVYIGEGEADEWQIAHSKPGACCVERRAAAHPRHSDINRLQEIGI